MKSLQMKKTQALAIIFAVLLISPAARASVLTFDDAFPNLPAPLLNGAEIDPSYGDTNQVDVDSGLFADFASTAKADQPVVYFDADAVGGYGVGAPSGVAISSVDNAVAEFSFTAKQDGLEILLESFDVGSYPNGGVEINGGFAIFDAAMNLLWSQLIPVGGPVETISVNITAADGLRFRWGTSFDIGVDNIVFSVRDAAAPPSGVSAPGTLALLAAGFGLARFFSRRPASAAVAG